MLGVLTSLFKDTSLF